MGFWTGWWANELTRPNNQYNRAGYEPPFTPTLGDARAHREAEEAYQKGIQIGRQDESAFKEGTLHALREGRGLEHAKAMGFNTTKELADQLERGKVRVSQVDGKHKFEFV